MIQQFQDCYASFKDDCLTIGNAQLERSFCFANGALLPGEWIDKASGKTATRQPSTALWLPFGAFEQISACAKQEDCGGLSSPFLAVTVTMENPAAKQILRLEVFPTLPFCSSRLSVQPKTGAAADSMHNGDKVESLALTDAHCSVTTMELFDKTDRHDTLIKTMQDSPYPATENKYRGDIFLIQPAADSSAILLAKDAPVGTSHLCRPEYDLEIAKNQVALCGSGVDFSALKPGEETEYYGATVGIGAAADLLKEYKRLLRCRRKGEGHLFTMANTWGDRNCEKSLCEKFLSEELKAAGQIGVDVLQIDDGWETGAITDPENYMDHVWEGYHSAAENYWSVDATRFPQGLQPVADEAKQRGVSLGLWFSPDSADDFANWRADAKILGEFHQSYGIRYFKLDGVNVRSKTGDRNFSLLMEAVNREGASLQLDVTAGDRFGYHYKPQYGVLFVENRYSDWGNYFPYRTLRNLWMLSRVLPACSMQFEVLNPRRNPEPYADDVFAPQAYEMDYLFATVMVANPLLWCELSHLEAKDSAALQVIVAAWRPHSRALFESDVLPVGEEPNGRSCTGFWACRSDSEGYFVFLREKNERSTARYQIPPLTGKRLQIELIAANGAGEVQSDVSSDGIVTVHFSRPNQYLFVRYRTK